MKKIFVMLLVLVLIYFGIQLGFRFFGSGHEYQYQVTTNGITFDIQEKLTNNQNNEMDSYYFEINNDKNTFYYQTQNDFKKKARVIKDVYAYQTSEYNCILPIFDNDQIITDIMCLKDDKIYYYHDIKNNNELKPFAESLKQYGYDITRWNDNKQEETYENVTIYPNNIIDNHNIGLANYKGVYLINPSVGNEVENVNLFQFDVYKRPLSTIFKNYYVTVNYNEQYRFSKILVVDLTNKKQKEINCNAEISFDSYIQGTYDESIYIFDPNTKRQYEINLKTEKVLEVGNENSGILIYNGDEKSRISANEAKLEEVKFNLNQGKTLNISGYVKIDLQGGKDTGFYYLYEKVGNKYNVYRANISSVEQLTYIFTTTDCNRIVYHNEYTYFLEGNIIKYYSDKTGVKSAISNSELAFNDSLIFGIYSK